MVLGGGGGCGSPWFVGVLGSGLLVVAFVDGGLRVLLCIGAELGWSASVGGSGSQRRGHLCCCVPVVSSLDV